MADATPGQIERGRRLLGSIITTVIGAHVATYVAVVLLMRVPFVWGPFLVSFLSLYLLIFLLLLAYWGHGWARLLVVVLLYASCLVFLDRMGTRRDLAAPAWGLFYFGVATLIAFSPSIRAYVAHRQELRRGSRRPMGPEAPTESSPTNK